MPSAEPYSAESSSSTSASSVSSTHTPRHFHCKRSSMQRSLLLPLSSTPLKRPWPIARLCASRSTLAALTPAIAATQLRLRHTRIWVSRFDILTSRSLHLLPSFEGELDEVVPFHCMFGWGQAPPEHL